MNYLLIVIVLGVGAAAYCIHEQDQAQIVSLQQQLQDQTAKNAAAASQPPQLTLYPTSPPPPPVISPAEKARADAEKAVADYAVGTVTTTDGHTYTHCKVLKQEEDGVTFNHDQGITKLLFWNMEPAVQKIFGYDVQKVAATEAAQARYAAQQTAVLPATTSTVPAANP